MQLIENKENAARLPMLVLSGQQGKEAANEHSTPCERGFSTYLSASIVFGHELYLHGPFFSTLTTFGLKTKRSAKRWTLPRVVYLSLLMAMESATTLKDRFEAARTALVEMFPNDKRPGETYQGFIKARRRITTKQMRKIKRHLRKHHKHITGKFWKRSGWEAFAVDGTRVEVPRTAANESVLKCAGRKKTGPQLSLTTLYQMGTGLPWAWRFGAGVESEVGHLRQMSDMLPKESLLVADAGFTGFELLRGLMARGVEILVRMGSNRELLKGLGDIRVEVHGEIVWFWPLNYRKTTPPLMLRLIRIEKPNKSPVFLVTSVLDSTKLTDEEVGTFYQMRWGEEVFYRSFKRTLGAYKMRSDSPGEAKRELDWAMLSYVTLGVMSMEGMIAEGRDPLIWSPAESLRVVRRALRLNGSIRRMGDLRVLLSQAEKDRYHRQRPKASRNWPNKKNDPPPGKPKIREATAKEKADAKRIYENFEAA